MAPSISKAVLAAFAYLVLTVGLSVWYVALVTPAMINDYWWPGFSVGGVQTFLGDYFNRQISISTNASSQLPLASLRVPKAYTSHPTFIQMSRARPRSLLLAPLPLATVIVALRANNLDSNIRLFTQYSKCDAQYTANAAVYLEALLRNTDANDLNASPYMLPMNATIFDPLAALPGGSKVISDIFHRREDLAVEDEAATWRQFGLTTWQSQVTNYYEQGLVQTISIQNALGMTQRVTVYAVPSQFRGLALWSTVYAYAGFWNDLWTGDSLQCTLLLGVDAASDAIKANWEYNMNSVATLTPVLRVVHLALGPLASMDVFVLPKPRALLAYLAAYEARLNTIKDTAVFRALVETTRVYPVPPSWTGGYIYYTGSPMCFSAPAHALPQEPMGFYDTCDGAAPLSVSLESRSVLFALSLLPAMSPAAIAALCGSPSTCARVLEPAVAAAAQLPIASGTSAVWEALKATHVSVYQFAANGTDPILLHQALADASPWGFFGLVMLYEWLYGRREVYVVSGDVGAITTITRRYATAPLEANALELPQQACVYMWYLTLYASLVVAAVSVLVLTFGWTQRKQVSPLDLLHANRLIGCVWVGRPFLLVRGLTALVLLSTSSVRFVDDASLPGNESGFQDAPRSLVSTMIIASEATWMTYVVVDFGLPLLRTFGHVRSYGPLSAFLAWTCMVLWEAISPFEASVVVAPDCTQNRLGLQVTCAIGSVAIGSLPRLLALLGINMGCIPAAMAVQRLCTGPTARVHRAWRPHVLVPAAAEVFLSKVHSELWHDDVVTSVLSGLVPCGGGVRLDLKLWCVLRFDTLRATYGPILPFASLSVPLLSMRRFYVRALGGFAYVVFSIIGSYTYIYVSETAMTNDFWWASFNATGHQTYLTNWFNRQLQFTGALDAVELAAPQFSDNAHSYNATSPLASAPLVVYASSLQSHVNSLAGVIAGLRRMNPCLIAYISTSYCYVDFNRAYELGATAARQDACARHTANGAVYLESVLRNVLDWTRWQHCYGSSLETGVFSYLASTTRGQAWVREVRADNKLSLAMEEAYWRRMGIAVFATEWQNYKTLGVIETIAIENALGMQYPLTLKRSNGTLHTSVQSSFKMHWTLANDLYIISSNASHTVGSSLVRQSPQFLYRNTTPEALLIANGTLPAPMDPGFSLLRDRLGPFGTITMQRVAPPRELLAWYKASTEALMAHFVADVATATAYREIAAGLQGSPIPLKWVGAEYVGGDVTCPTMPSPATLNLLEFFTAAGACTLGVSNSVVASSSMVVLALLAADFPTPAAICAAETVNVASCPDSYAARLSFVRSSVPTTLVAAVQSPAARIQAQLAGQVQLVQFLRDRRTNRTVLLQESLLSSASFAFHSWLFLFEWVHGVREVVSFVGDTGEALTILSGRNTISTQAVNGMEVPVNVSHYCRRLLLFITFILATVAMLVVVYALRARGAIEGLNMFCINRVAGLVWIGRPLLLLRGTTAICLLSTATLDLTQVVGFYAFAPSTPAWYTTIMASGEITWLVFILNDAFSLVTKQHTARYGMEASLGVWAGLAIGTFLLPVRPLVTLARACDVSAVDFQVECRSGVVAIGRMRRFAGIVGGTTATVVLVYLLERWLRPRAASAPAHSHLLYATAKYHYATDGWIVDGVYYVDRASAVLTGLLSFEWRRTMYILDIKTWRQYAIDVSDARDGARPFPYLAQAIPMKL
ncbi:hypothetical protein SPRG_02302 [Saprolegnia parasitica CBS 223.65]|uniref:Uncharacterized protein n=1 Tax=Saprolegnia parasitica (strain CBS 223.65) TaxID=695850 RepID=A0A067CS05_SAPPC|nr:hypothetical protein SPRG_02302 [Saprolegnia parasitica CBS 223.65]KDO33494.1 hypothetical protein SPRG_02302 [Saprolegnia parasitica CBS 223.65]|eukprot:XP_012196238.1 hypothetical protein SPRG_02302 [Saprolegnia parasitica CBS 223.65]